MRYYEFEALNNVLLLSLFRLNYSVSYYIDYIVGYKSKLKSKNKLHATE